VTVAPVATAPVPVASPAPPPPPPSPEPEAGPSHADWDFATSVYKQDQIITLAVTGYNRGGLLVESERLQGFVP
jgi:hypothetical protein